MAPIRIRNRTLKLILLMTVLAAETGLCVTLAMGGDVSFHLLRITDGISLDLGLDGLGRLFIILISGGWLLTGLFACEYMKHEKNEDRFFAFMLLSEGAMLMTALSANMATLYTAYELLTLVSMPMVLLSLP